MRKNYREKLPSFKQKLAPANLPEDQCITMYTVELFVTGCKLIDPNMPILEASSIMAGHDVPVLSQGANLDMAHRLRVLFRDIRTKRAWDQYFQFYRQLPPQLCLYDSGTDNWRCRKPVVFAEREQWYKQLLEGPVENESGKPKFASLGEFLYFKDIPNEEPLHYKGSIPYIPDPILQFPKYREKERFKLDVQDGVFRPMQALKEIAASSEWKRREGQVIRLKPIQDESLKVLHYQGIQHIIGGLGSGKSTFMVAEAARLVQQGARLGFIEGSVPQVLNRVRELRQLGVRAIPIIGKTSRAKHRDDFLAARQHEIYDVADWSSDDQQELQYLSDHCLIRALANDEDVSTDYPCRKLRQQDKKDCLCPYAAQCGVYQGHSKLIDAQVWVTTSASILQSKLPLMLDPHERTIYEAMYDLLDIIFIDEADAVQKQFDDAFLEEHALFGSTKHFFEQLLIETTRRTAGNYSNSGDVIIEQWIERLHRSFRFIRNGVYNKLRRVPKFASSLRRRMIQLSTESYRISRVFTRSNEQEDEFKRRLERFSQNPIHDDLFEEVERLMETSSFEERQTILKGIVVSLGGQIEPKGRYRYPYDWLEFYLYLSVVDHDLGELRELYPLIRARLGLFGEVNMFQSNQRGFSPWLKEAMTGRLTGYMYEVKVEGIPGTFKTVDYTGIGRQLLRDWFRTFERSDAHAGPAVVLLSGTSYAPGSPHYDVGVEPTWLIESEWSPPSIHQRFYPMYESGSSYPITISGESEDRRSENLRRLTTLLLPKIEQELAEWKQIGTHRRVLLIVNSYDDVDDVAAALKLKHAMAGRYRQLSRNMDGVEDTAFMRSELERFMHDPADVLIAPLLAISRGYNILDENKGSLFGTVFFLVRPYPIPNDMSYLIQLLHAKLPDYLAQIEQEGIGYQEALRFIRHESHTLFHRLYRKEDYWSSLTRQERLIVAWFTFVPIWQTIGRLLRKGTSARVFYCDGKFDTQPMNADDGESMLDYWMRNMREHEGNYAFRSLYGPFIDSIRDMLKEEEDEPF